MSRTNVLPDTFLKPLITQALASDAVTHVSFGVTPQMWRMRVTAGGPVYFDGRGATNAEMTPTTASHSLASDDGWSTWYNTQDRGVSLLRSAGVATTVTIELDAE